MPNRTYIATAEVGELLAQSPTLKEHEKGKINLYFLRAGMFNQFEADTIACLRYKGGNQHEASRLPHIPVIPHFRNFETTLNSGYLYIIEDNGVYHEFKVLQNGLLVSIVWDGPNLGKDIRNPLSNRRDIRRYLSFRKGREIWVAYSPVQWTISYFTEVLNDTSKRDKRMKNIKVTGLQKGVASEDPAILPYTDARPTFNVKVGETKAYLDDRFIPIWGDLERISAVERTEEKDSLLEDMFVVLDDHIGCATDIAWRLKMENLRLDALLESIQTGKNEDDIFERIKEDENSATEVANDDVSHLIALAITINSTLFGESKAKSVDKVGKEEEGVPEKYKKCTDLVKLNKVLGVEERKKIKEQIEKIRESLEIFLQSEYCQKGFEVYADNGDQLFYGVDKLLRILTLLAVFSHDKDRLLTPPRQVIREDQREAFFQKLYSGDSGYPIYDRLLKEAEEISFIDENGCVNENTVFAKQFKKENGYNLIEAIRDTADTFIGQIIRLRYIDLKAGDIGARSSKTNLGASGGSNVVSANRVKLEQALTNKFGPKVQPRLNSIMNNNGITMGRTFQLSLDTDQYMEYLKTNTVKFDTGRFVRLEKFFNHYGFKGSLAGLEVINLIVKLTKEDKTVGDRFSIAGSSVLLAYFGLEFAKSLKLAGSVLTKVSPYIAALGYGGAALGVVVAVLDAIELFQADDYWAGGFSIGVAVGSATLLVMMILKASVASMLWTAGITLILGILVYIFSSDELENFLKFNAMGKKATALPAAAERPWQYIAHLCNPANRTAIIPKDSYRRLRDFEYARLYMDDFLPTFTSVIYFLDSDPVNIKRFDYDQFKGPLKDDGPPPSTLKVPVYIPRIVMVRTRCDMFTPNVSKFDFALWLGSSLVQPGLSSKDFDFAGYGNKFLDSPNEKALEASELIDGTRYVITEKGFYIDTFYTLTKEEIESCESGLCNFEFRARLIQDSGTENTLQRKVWPSEYRSKKRYRVYEYDPFIHRRDAYPIKSPRETTFSVSLEVLYGR